jgi:hypothetical protein
MSFAMSDLTPFRPQVGDAHGLDAGRPNAVARADAIGLLRDFVG